MAEIISQMMGQPCTLPPPSLSESASLAQFDSQDFLEEYIISKFLHAHCVGIEDVSQELNFNLSELREKDMDYYGIYAI